MSAVLFIDANQYLNLYRMAGGGKQLLDALIEQKAHIFICRQIADEVLRNKLEVAQLFFAELFKGTMGSVPYHLLGEDEVAKKSFDQRESSQTTLRSLASDALCKMSRSEDDVSKRLESLFDKAIPATDEEIRRARERKEVGNPPGKKNGPIGDQMAWEQLLTYCKANKRKRVWIITNDGDHLSTWKGRSFLNAFLYRELSNSCGAPLEVHCFRNLMEGIRHFAKHAGVIAEKLPTPEETVVIRNELDALPPFGWFSPNDGDAAVIQNYLIRQRYRAAMADAGNSADTPLTMRDAED